MDNLDIYLRNICVAQAYAKKMINKEIKVVDKINKLSISSVKQKNKLCK